MQEARPGAADPQQGPLEQRPRAQPRRRRDAHAGDGPDPRRRRGEPHRHRPGRRDQRADRRRARAARARPAGDRRPPRHHGRRLRLGRRHQPGLAPLRHVHRQRAGARVRRLGRRDQALQPRGELGGLLQPARRPRPPRRHHRGDAAPDRDRQVPDDLGEPPVPLPLDGRLHRRHEADHRGARRRDDGARRLGRVQVPRRQEARDRAVLRVPRDVADRRPQGPQQRLLRHAPRHRPRGRQPAREARPRAQVRRHGRRHAQPQVRVDQEHRVLHRQGARLDGRRPAADADRARPARPLRGALPAAVGPARRLPRQPRLLHVPVGLRQEHPLRLPGPRRPGPLLRAHVLHGRAPRQDDHRAAGRDRRAVRRHRDREQRLQVHAHAHDQEPGEAGEGRPQRAPRRAPARGRQRRGADARRARGGHSHEARDPALHARGRDRGGDHHALLLDRGRARASACCGSTATPATRRASP